MGVFSELDLENQQTELDGHDSKAAEMQTLQAKLIQQHEQKKAAAAAEAPGKEPAAEPVAKTEAEQEDPASSGNRTTPPARGSGSQAESGMGAAAGGKARCRRHGCACKN